MIAIRRSRSVGFAVAGLLAALTLGVFASAAGAATFTVVNTDPAGAGSLDAAIDSANANGSADTIVFAPATNAQLISEPGTTIEAGGTLTITGNGVGVTKIDGELDINSDTDEVTTVVVSNLTVGDFNINSGGGGTTKVTITNVDVNSDGLNINSDDGSTTNVTMTNVRVTGGGEIDANALDSTTKVSITNSSVDRASFEPMNLNDSGTTVTVTGSTFSNSGNAIGVEDATLHLTNSTISGNGADDDEGGINSTGAVTLQNVTVTKNAVGAIDVSGGTFAITNSILADNGSSEGGECTIGDAVLTSHGGNLSDDSSCNPIAGDHKDTQPNLGPLANNGGPTRTHLPLTGSAAIDGAIATGCPKTDQRGVARPQDGNNDGTVACDVGAVEIAAKVAPVTSTTASVQPLAATTTTSAPVAAAELPRTGSSSSGLLAVAGALLVGVGAMLLSSARKRARVVPLRARRRAG